LGHSVVFGSHNRDRLDVFTVIIFEVSDKVLQEHRTKNNFAAFLKVLHIKSTSIICGVIYSERSQRDIGVKLIETFFILKLKSEREFPRVPVAWLGKFT
jgi:hypothetical protein